MKAKKITLNELCGKKGLIASLDLVHYLLSEVMYKSDHLDLIQVNRVGVALREINDVASELVEETNLVTLKDVIDD